jgi:acetyl-CoA carboxylase carboxyl transferase subunit beta
LNWITKFIKPKIESLFKKKTTDSDQVLWTTCECKNLIYKEDLQKNFNCCPKCNAHHKLSCVERFNIFFDNKEFKIIETPLPKDDPLNFVDNKKYTDRLKSARKITKQDDAVSIATGKVENIQVTVGAQDFRFIGGSFGAASGEAFIHGAQHAIDNKNPFIFFSCSGGQRMMESSIALMQMSRTVLAVNELKKNNIPFIVVLTNPTTGGVTASWAMLGDILIAEPKATIGFAGKRVIADTIRETLPANFQTAEWARDSGQIDLVVERQFLRPAIGKLLTVLLKKRETQVNTDTSNVVTLDSSIHKTSKALQQKN